MDLFSLLLQLVSGAAGGNVAGGVLKNINLGTFGNSLAGVIGGGVGSAILASALGLPTPAPGTEPDVTALLTQVLGGGAGGGVLTIAVGLLKEWLSTKTT